MVFLRWTFTELEPTEADPPAWIAAGAVAITVLAGSNLLGAAAASPRIERLAPFIEGIVMLAWATATFWFPLMVAIGIWRHLISRVPLRYHPSYWALVFPLGMYGAATFRMRAAIELDALEWLPQGHARRRAHRLDRSVRRTRRRGGEGNLPDGWQPARDPIRRALIPDGCHPPEPDHRRMHPARRRTLRSPSGCASPVNRATAAASRCACRDHPTASALR